MLKRAITDDRMADEFNYLVAHYPAVAFNYRTWTGQSNDRAHGKRHLYATEGYITVPQNYDMGLIKQYDTFICPNSKFKEMHPELNITVTSGPLRTDDFYDLGPEELPSFSNRINGIAAFLKLYNTGREGDILQLRHDAMCHMAEVASPDFTVDAYGPVPYGPLGHYFPDPGQNVFPRSFRLYMSWKRMAQYRFCFCPEPMCHPLWSWDWVTERILNCWKTKTIPVYIGAYNIEQRIPMKYIVDFRKFQNDYKGLISYLEGMIEREWLDVVEPAYEYEKTCRIGNVEDIEAQLAALK